MIKGKTAIDFSSFPEKAARAVLNRLELPLETGMTADQIIGVLGCNYEIATFTSDRKTYKFISADDSPYNVSCTVLNRGGLTYLVVTVPLSLRASEQVR